MQGIDLTDLDNFSRGFPHDLFEIHRREAPVFWHEPTEHTPDGEGFWSVATHADTLTVVRDAETYSSERGGDRPYGGTLLQDLEVAGIVLNMMDDPRHARIRRLVSAGLAMLDDLFAKRREHRIIAARARLEPKRDLGAKVRELTKILDEDGYLASSERMASGVYRIVEHNCAIWAVAQRYGQACTSELEFIRTVLPGATVERVEHMISGARRCAYEVRALAAA